MQTCNAINGSYTVIHYENRTAINEQKYLRLILANAFETVTANCWLNNYSGPVSFAKSATIHVVGKRKMLDYKEILDIYQATILNDCGEWTLTAIPQSLVADNDDLIRLIQLSGHVSSEPLQCFIYDAFLDRSFARQFCNLPASHGYHHSFKGGLLRHSLECASIVAQCPALSATDKDMGVVAALFHDAGKVLTMKDDKKTPMGYLVDHDALTLSALYKPLQQLDKIWIEAAMGLRHIWTCRSSRQWGFKAKMPVASVVQMADQVSTNRNHEDQAFASLPLWRNNAKHPTSDQRFWRVRPYKKPEYSEAINGGYCG